MTELTNIYFFTRKSTEYALKNTNLRLVFYGDFRGFFEVELGGFPVTMEFFILSSESKSIS